MGIIKVGPIRMYGYHGCLPEEEKMQTIRLIQSGELTLICNF